jgi:hypothetical protein
MYLRKGGRIVTTTTTRHGYGRTSDMLNEMIDSGILLGVIITRLMSLYIYQA